MSDRDRQQKIDDVCDAFESLRFSFNLDEHTISRRAMRTLAVVAVQVIEDGPDADR